MKPSALREQIYQCALPLLKGRVVTDLVVGLSLLAVELDHHNLAVSYVLRDHLAGGCSIFPYANAAVGMDAEEVGRWFVTGRDDVQRAIGGAVLNAASQCLSLPDCGSREKPFDLDLKPSDTIGMVGMIGPVAKQLKARGCTLKIFDKGKCPHGRPEEDLYPMEQQAELLPQCDIIFLSGTTAINGSAAPLLDMCAQARDVVLVGASTPMVPDGFRGTSASILAGSWWRQEDKADLFRLISRAAGMKALSSYAIKKNVRIRSESHEPLIN